LPTKFFVLVPELFHLRQWGVGVLVLDGEPIPGLLPPRVGFQINSASLNKGQQEGFTREEPSLQHVAKRGTAQRYSFDRRIWKLSAGMLGAVLQYPERRAVGKAVNVPQARCQIIEAGCCDGVKLIHGGPALKTVVRGCPLVSVHGTAQSRAA
jgi:hypothetical protein